MGPLVAPAAELGVEVRDVAEGASGEEAIAKETDLSLHPSLLVAPGDVAGTGEVVVVAGELEQTRMELDRLALAGEHRALQVVVQEGPRGALEVREGLDVPAEEALHGLVEGEQGVDRARPAEHHDEGREGSAGLSDLEMAEVSPVDLGLLTGKGGETQEGLGLGLGAQPAHHTARLDGRAAVAAGDDHLVDAGGAKPGVVLQHLADEAEVGVELAGSRSGGGVEARGLERPADGVGVETELARNGPDAPVLGVEEAADLGALGLGDHDRPGRSGASRRRCTRTGVTATQRGTGAPPAAETATDRAAERRCRDALDHEGSRLNIGCLQGRCTGLILQRRAWCAARPRDPDTRLPGLGRVIPHAPATAPATAPLALPIAVIQTALGAPTMPPSRLA
jgi:hypothetical protein